MPETTFTFRVDQDLKNAFTEAARANDQPGSQLLRDFMREYVERVDHDAWFRAEVEQSLKEAADPNVELIPHEEVVQKRNARLTELTPMVHPTGNRSRSCSNSCWSNAAAVSGAAGLRTILKQTEL
jgi:predicted transcriptional regulator